jgi:CelD/BcsL family acetyltransferase involved in cellulose biosynthesis
VTAARSHWITEPGELRARAGDWAALCDRASSGSPFGRPEWLLPWHEVFGGAAPLRVLAIEDPGALLALVPLQEIADPGGPALTLMGGDVSDHHDAPVAAEADLAHTVLPAAAHAIAVGDWESVRLDRLRGDAWMRRLPAQTGWRAAEAAEEPPCPTLVAAAEARTLDDVLPPGFAYRLGRQRRHAERRGGVRLRLAATVDEALGLFDALSAFHAARWQARGEPGVLADPDVQRFHRLVIPAMQGSGLLRLYALELAGALAAVVYGFSVGGRLSFYLCGFDAAHESASPGALTVAGAIERELQACVRVFDFLRGREAYKYRFGARDAACFTVTAQRELRDGTDGAAVGYSGAGASSSSRV